MTQIVINSGLSECELRPHETGPEQRVEDSGTENFGVRQIGVLVPRLYV